MVRPSDAFAGELGSNRQIVVVSIIGPRARTWESTFVEDKEPTSAVFRDT